MAITAFTGLSGLSSIYGSSLVAPPSADDQIAYYEASLGTLDAGDAAADDLEKIKTWQDQIGSAHLVQATAGNQLRIRKGRLPSVCSSYADGPAAGTEFAQTTLSIDKRASSFFALVEFDQMHVQGVTVIYVIMSLPGGVGDLCYRAITGNYPTGQLYWRDASGNYDTGIKVRSDCCLVGVILDAGEIRVVYNDQTYTVPTPLSAGTVTGFSLFKGSVGTIMTGAFNCAFWYGIAVDSTQLAAVRAWASGSRRVAFNPTKIIVASGASNSQGHIPAAGKNWMRQYAIAHHGEVGYYNIGFAGNGLSQQVNHILTWLFGSIAYNAPGTGTGLHSTTNRIVFLVICPTNDITAGTSLATMTTYATQIREMVKSYGMDAVFYHITPVGGWSAAQNTKRDDFKAAMLALDQNQYGPYLTLPTEIDTDPTNTTYYHTDQTHLLLPSHDLLYADGSSRVDTYLAQPHSALQGWIKFDNNYEDSGQYRYDWQAVGSPTFVDGAWGDGRKALRTAAGGNIAKSKLSGRQFDVDYWSAMFWFRTTTTGSMWMLTKYTGASGNWYSQKHSTGTFRVIITGAPTLISSSTYFHDGNWHCVAFTTDATGVKLYGSPDHLPANLVLQDSKAWSAGVAKPIANNFFRVGGVDDATTEAADFQDIQLRWGLISLAELQAVVVT